MAVVFSRSIVWLFAAVATVSGAGVLATSVTWNWTQIPVHSAIEVAGGLSAVLLAVLLLTFDQKGTLSTCFWFSAGLLSMGMADILHSLVMPGNAFVWFHSLALFLGGIFAALSWLGSTWVSRENVFRLIVASSLPLLILAALSVINPSLVPAMVVAGKFTAAATFLNFGGGIGFVVAAGYFLKLSRDADDYRYLLFFLICLLNAVAGLFFNYSNLWNFTWWLWHLLRLLGALAALVYLVFLVRKAFSAMVEVDELQELLDRLVAQQAELERQSWLKDGLALVEQQQRGAPRLGELAGKLVSLVAGYLKAEVGALYVNDGNDQFVLAAGYAYGADPGARGTFAAGEGLVGQAAVEKRPLELTDLPDNYLRVVSGLGSAKPRVVIVQPLLHDNISVGVLELGSLNAFTDDHKAFLAQVSMPIAMAINAARSRKALQEALAESQQLAEELQAQQEELRAANEELEEHTRHLQASEEQLKAQQEELQAANEELEEKTFYLEKQQSLLQRLEKSSEGEEAAGRGEPEFPDAEVVNEFPEAGPEMAVAVEPRFENRTILLVDDDMRNVFSLTQILEGRGLRVLKAFNGSKALDLLEQEESVDLVLMDIMMPEMDGYEAMERIRASSRYGDVPILALTAKAMQVDRQKCIEAGANDYLSKPVDIDKLFSLIRVWLKN